MEARWLVSFAGIVLSAAGLGSQPLASRVQTCDQITTTRPGFGSRYEKLIHNADYNFSAELPPGIIGWSGVDESAPFHGFTVFLDAKRVNCIIFELHLRVDESEAPSPDPEAKSLSLGEAKAFQTVRIGMVNGLRVSNVRTSFSFRQAGQFEDGEIILITPSSDAHKSTKIYERFLGSVVFGR